MVTGGRLLLAAAMMLPIGRHPMHTSSAEVVQQGDSVTVAIRAFADDIGTVDVLPGYARERFRLLDRSGSAVALTWDGAERHDDVVVLRLRGRLGGGLAGGRVENRILTDRFADQVNVVRAIYDGRTTTLIFTRGDGPKALP